MAMQPITTRPGAPAQIRPMPVPAQPQTSLGVLIGVVTALMLSLAGIGLAIMNAPSPVVTDTTVPEALKVANSESAPVAEGKELVTKITELETKLAQSRRDIQKLNEELQNVVSQMDGLSANLAIAQSQAADRKSPVNIQPPQPEPEPTPEKKN